MTEDDAPTGVAIGEAETLERVNRSEEGCLFQVILIVAVVGFAVAALYILILAPK